MARSAENMGMTSAISGYSLRPSVTAKHSDGGQTPAGVRPDGDQFKELVEEEMKFQRSADVQETGRLRDSFSTWKTGYLRGGVSQDVRESVTAQSDNFVALMGKAVREGGYENPQAFVESLSRGELETIRVVSGLAQTIEPSSLSEEGALNLLLPRSEARDLNNDGFTMNGLARTWSFPPTNAPNSVKAAWGATVEGMSMKDELLAQALFMPLLVEVNAAGAVQEISPSDYVHPFAADDFSYTRLVQDRLDAVVATRHLRRPENYARTRAILDRFLEELAVNDVG